MKPPPRVVLDTNVVVSALVFGGNAAARVRRAWQAGEFVPLISTETASELIRVLAYPKFRLEAYEQEELLADYLPYTLAVRIPNPPPTVPDCRDPFDVPFLHLAMAGKAHALVSGDRDLLALAPRLKVKVLTLDAFVADSKINY
jgi:putative PIN family toxin of toxin-antitoxin system